MSKKSIVGLILAGLIALAFVLIIGCSGAFGGSFIGRAAEGIPFEAISKMLFNEYGALLLILGGLMFGAIIAGVAISKEEEDE